MIKVYIIGKSVGRPWRNVLKAPHPRNPKIVMQFEKTDIRIRGYWETLAVGYLREKINTSPPSYAIVYSPDMERAKADYYLRDDFYIAPETTAAILPDDLFEIS